MSAALAMLIRSRLDKRRAAEASQHGAALKEYQICEQILRKELSFDPQQRLASCTNESAKGKSKRFSLRSRKRPRPAPPHNLPFQISTFIGRERELDDVTDLVANRRLVTLVGTGSIGKTRPSLKVGEGLLK